MSQRVYVRNLGGTPTVIDVTETADITANFLAAAGTQAEQETATSVTKYVTPGRQQFHSSAAKGWVMCGVSADVQASYNVTSVTDGGTGAVTVTWATDFSSANFSTGVSILHAAAFREVQITSQTAGTSVGACADAAAAGVQDPTNWFFQAFGDQA